MRDIFNDLGDMLSDDDPVRPGADQIPAAIAETVLRDRGRGGD